MTKVTKLHGYKLFLWLGKGLRRRGFLGKIEHGAGRKGRKEKGIRYSGTLLYLCTEEGLHRKNSRSS